MLAECAEANIIIQLNTQIKNVIKKTDGFSLQANNRQLTCHSLIIATGGLSIPSMGSSAFAYQLAEQFDIHVWPTRAGLVPLTLHETEKNRFAELSGVAIDTIVNCNNTEFKEALLFTHRGLSGPAILQISSYWQPGEIIEINCLPHINLNDIFITEQKNNPKQSLRSVLNRLLPKRVVSTLLPTIELDQPLQSFKHSIFNELTQQLQAWQIKPNGTEGYRTAEVTLGGIDCDALSSKTMECRAVPGLYFIGEAVDVTGWLGGYNFQWAWSSGWAAGQVC